MGQGSSSLHQLVAVNDIAAVRVFVQEYPDRIDDPEPELGRTPLHVAALTGHDVIARELVARKASLIARDANGSTPLHLAAASGRLEAARSLLQSGADQYLPDADGYTAIQKAEQGGWDEIASLLKATPRPVKQRPADALPAQPSGYNWIVEQPPVAAAPSSLSAPYPQVAVPYAGYDTPAPPSSKPSPFDPLTAAPPSDPYAPSAPAAPSAPPAPADFRYPSPPSATTPIPPYPSLYTDPPKTQPQASPSDAPPAFSYPRPPSPPTDTPDSAYMSYLRPPGPVTSHPVEFPSSPTSNAAPHKPDPKATVGATAAGIGSALGKLAFAAAGAATSAAGAALSAAAAARASSAPSDTHPSASGAPPAGPTDQLPAGARPYLPYPSVPPGGSAYAATDLAPVTVVGPAGPRPPASGFGRVQHGQAAAVGKVPAGNKEEEEEDEGGWGDGGKATDWGGEEAEPGSSDDEGDDGGWGDEPDPDADWGDKPGRKKPSEAPAGALPLLPAELAVISFQEVQAATGGFAPERLMGEGAWGPVYWGDWRGARVAVKALDTLPDTVQGPEDLEAQARDLYPLAHPNLEPLQALCTVSRPCLLYGLPPTPPTSLQQHLQPQGADPDPLPWPARLQAAVDVARALVFLHTQQPEPLAHMAVRPCNIWVTPGGGAYLAADPLLATATLRAENGAEHNKKSWFERSHRGLRPSSRDAQHLDPHYAKTGHSGPESDVYSLGLVLLQLLTGRPVSGLVDMVAACVAAPSGSPATLPVDPRAGSWPPAAALQMARLALDCTRADPSMRPPLQRQVLPALLQLQEQASRPQLPPPLAPNPQLVPQMPTPLATPPPKLASFELQPPPMFICPITQDIMDDPVVAADGYTYEREAIEGWLLKSAASPMTNLPMPSAAVVPNHTIRSAIKEWVDRHGRP